MQELINSLINNFDTNTLKDFLYSKDENFEFFEEFYSPQDEFSEIELVATKKLQDGNDLSVFAIKTTSQLSERASKKRQFELARKLLDTADCGLFVFYDENGNFRFSFVYKTYRGKTAELSSYKRYTYFVEKGKKYRTFEKALTELRFDSLQSIKEAFSTKPLIDEFYREIQNWYAWALKDPSVWFPSGRKEEHLIRLITRLVFVWFLKERKLIPEEIFDPESLKGIVKDFMEGTNYYNAILQNLFFATLNMEIKDRKFAQNKGFPSNKKEFGVKTLYRYQELLKISEEEFIKLFKNTPFVNGGLFECLDDDNNYIDGFSREEKKRAKIPDYLFFSGEKVEDLTDFYGEKKKEKVRGLINILKDYNFTADESTPIDIDISLDPELLGHIFESLLEYVGEGDKKTKKSTGSYYTPSEIVDFMVEIAILEYLKQKTDIDHQTLEELVASQSTPQLTEQEKDKIIQAIDSVKILDPAVGSGAFPMGILHKLTFILEKIDPDNSLWKKHQHQKAVKEAEEILKNENKDIRQELFNQLNENFDETLRYPDYARKLYIIQNSIYGVDIQNIAIQITKLRFFLSLLIDQKTDPNKPNFGIKPLPHLETNFVCADTLMKLEKELKQNLKQEKMSQLLILSQEQELHKLKQELLSIHKKYFSIKTREEKLKIKNMQKNIRNRIGEILETSIGLIPQTARKIAKFDIFSQTAQADWFDPEWMFGIEEGFDIVIGNPPYIRQERIKPIKGNLKKNYPEIYNSTSDIYVYFFARGYELLKEDGILVYITSNKWLRAKYGEKIREFFKEKTKILYLIDFAGHRVFETATVDTCITAIKKQQEKNDQIKVAVIDSVEEDNIKNIIKQKLFSLSQEKLSQQVYVLEDDTILKLKEKIERIGRPLKDWDIKIYYGIKTGFNEAFIIDSQKRQEILDSCKDEDERKRTEDIIKPCLKGKNIKKYSFSFDNLYMLILYKGINIDNFPSVKSHLLKYKNQLQKRAGNQKWFELQSPPSKEKLSYLLAEKIGYSDIGFKFCFVTNSFIGDNTTYFIVSNNISETKYMLGILNSKLIYFYYTHLLASRLGGKASRGFTVYMNLLPIPPITDHNKPIVQQIENLVSQILQRKSQDPQTDTTNLETQIDQLVYSLYKLEPEEIKLIEGGNKNLSET